MNATRLAPAGTESNRLLLVEHDRRFGAELVRALERAGFRAEWIHWGCDLAPALRRERYLCVLLGLDLPDLCAEAALEAVRRVDAAQPLIVITPPGAMTERIRLLDMGADDHVTRPVDAHELAARVRAVTRRAQRAQSGTAELVHGPLRLQVDLRLASWHGREVLLTNMEFWLLETLVRRKQQVLSRSTLEEMLYGWGDETSSNTVEVYIHHLRRKFDRRLILTLRGVGYQIASGLTPGEPVD